MVERMVWSTSSSSNVYGVADDNSNSYKNMVMDVMKMNQCYVGQCPIVYKECNTYATKFLIF